MMRHEPVVVTSRALAASLDELTLPAEEGGVFQLLLHVNAIV